MKIKLRTIMAGPEFSGGAGDVLEVPDRLGDDLVLGGYAEEIPAERWEHTKSDPEPIETATAPDAPEAAVEPRARKGKR